MNELLLTQQIAQASFFGGLLSGIFDIRFVDIGVIVYHLLYLNSPIETIGIYATGKFVGSLTRQH